MNTLKLENSFGSTNGSSAPGHPTYGAPVDIPLAKIAPNPLNPRKVRTPAMVQTLASSIRAVGLQNPIKVVRLAEAERQATPQCDYKVLCGEGRRLAYLEGKMETIPAFILDLPPRWPSNWPSWTTGGSP